MASYDNHSSYSYDSDGSMTTDEITTYDDDDDVSVPPNPNDGWFSRWIGKIQNAWRYLSDATNSWGEESAVLLGYLDPSALDEIPEPILVEEMLRSEINGEEFVDQIIKAYESEDESQQGCCKSDEDRAEETRENTSVAAGQEELDDLAPSLEDINDDVEYIREYNKTLESPQAPAQVPSEIGIQYGLQTPPSKGSVSKGSPGSYSQISDLSNSPKKGSRDGSQSDTESSAAASNNSGYVSQDTGLIKRSLGTELTTALASGDMNGLYKMIAKKLYVKDVLLNVRDASSRRKANEWQMEQVWGKKVTEFAKSDDEHACCYICRQPLVPKTPDGGQPEMEHKLPCALFYALFVFIYTTYPNLLGLWQEFITIQDNENALRDLYIYINCTTHDSLDAFRDGLWKLWTPIINKFKTPIGKNTNGENVDNFLCVLLAYLMECAYAHHLCNQLKSNHLLFKDQIVNNYYDALKATLNPSGRECDLSTHSCIKPAVFEPATCNAERDTIMRGLEPPPPNRTGDFPVSTKHSVLIQMNYIKGLAIECGNIGPQAGGQRSHADIAIRNIKIAVRESKPVSAGSDVNGKVSMKRAKQMNRLARDYTGQVSIYVNKLNALRKCGIPRIELMRRNETNTPVKNFRAKLDVVVLEAVDVANTIRSNARSHLHNPYLAVKVKQNLCNTILKYKDALQKLHDEMTTKGWDNPPSENFHRITDALRRITRFITRPSVQKYLAGTTLATIREEDDAAGDATEDLDAATADQGYASATTGRYTPQEDAWQQGYIDGLSGSERPKVAGGDDPSGLDDAYNQGYADGNSRYREQQLREQQLRAMEDLDDLHDSKRARMPPRGRRGGAGSRKRKPRKIPRRTIRRGAPRRTQRRTQKRRRMQGRRFTRQRKNKKRTTQKRR